MTQCPGNEQLARLLDERLDPADLAAVEAHLEACALCQQALEGLTFERFSSPGWAAPAREPTPAAVADPAEPASDTSFLGADPGDERSSRQKRLILGPAPRQPSSLHPRPGDRLDPPVPTGAAGSAYPPEVDGYDIVGRLGRGGMGIVYRARQRGLDRLVALKMLRGGGFADPEAFARFQIEARAVARLRHPNVVQVFDVGESRGLPFVSLELLEGGSLESRLAGNPQPGNEAATLVATLARAIASAHRAGIVHRDLKPANVLFSRDDVAKITDFGLAKRLDEDDGATESGQVMGSPSFMAPEQARGETRDVKPTADIYSLGAILYQMLTGRPPFKGGSALETLRLVVEAEPVAPSRLRPGLARDLETICLKCLRKEASERYTDADALADDIDRFLAGSPIAARRVRFLERGWKWARREPALATLVVAASVGAVATLGLGSHALSRARIRAAQIESHAAEVRRRADEGAEGVQQADALIAARRWPDARDTLVQLALRLGAEPELADLRDRVEQTRDALGRLDRFLKQARRAQVSDARWLQAARHAGFDPRPVRLAAEAALEQVGQIRRDPGGRPLGWDRRPLPRLGAADSTLVESTAREILLIWVEAEAAAAPGEDQSAQARRGLELLDQVPTGGATDRARLLLRARLLAGLGAPREADAARSAAARLPATGSLDRLASGRERQLHGDPGGAAEDYKAALQLDAHLFRAQLLLAVCQLQAQQPEAAWAGLTTCLQRDPRAVGLLMLRGIASGEIAGQRLARSRTSGEEATRREAQDQFRAADDDFRTALDHEPDRDDRLALLINRGAVRTQAGALDDALADFEAACRLDPGSWVAHLNRGQVLQRQGRASAAIDQFTAAIALEPNQAGLFRARALARLGARAGSSDPNETDAALIDLDEAIRLDPSASADRAADQARRARVEHRLGRFEAALADSDAALAIAPDQPDAALVRVQTLLALKRYTDVVRACDSAIGCHHGEAELYELRGVARSSIGDHNRAIADQTHALTLDPGRTSARLRRGWSYLMVDAPRPALADFEAAIEQDSGLVDGFAGRGFALAQLGQHREATADAEALLNRGGRADPRTTYNAARIYARAAAGFAHPGASRRSSGGFSIGDAYGDRALTLLRSAIDQTPAERRPAFIRDVLQNDPVLANLRQLPQFGRLISLREATTP